MDIDTAASSGLDTLLEAGDLYSSTEWQRYLDALNGGGVGFTVSHSDGSLRAGLSVSRLGAEAHPLLRPDTRLPLAPDHAAAAEASERLLPTLSVGGRTPGTCAFLHAGRLEEPELAHLLDLHLAEAERIAEEFGLRSVSLPSVSEGWMVPALERRGYLRYGADLDSRIIVGGSRSFEEYVEQLPEAKARHQIRRDRRKIEAAGWTFSVERLEDVPLDDVCRLQAMNADRHGVGGGIEAARRKQELIMAMLPGRSWVAIGRTPEGEIGAASIFLRWRDELYSRQGGVDPDQTRGVPIFFETCFYQLIEHAIQTGASTIHYSVQSSDGKRLRGCEQTPQHTWLRCVDPVDQAWTAELLTGDALPAESIR